MRAQEFLIENIEPGRVIDLTRNWGNYVVLHGQVEAITPRGDVKIKIVRADPEPGRTVKLKTGDQVIVSRHYLKKAPLVSEQQLDELQFLGSECTKDCSGHRAGYDWSKARGGVDANSPWSPSFNKGAALAKAGK